MKTTIKEFTNLGRSKFYELVYQAEDANSKFRKEEINDLVFSETYTQQHSSNAVDSERLFEDRFDMTVYLSDLLLIGTDRENWHKNIFSNWGLMEWLTALYHEQLTAKGGVKDYNFLIIKNNRQTAQSSETFGQFNTSSGIARHRILPYLIYYSRYQKRLKPLLGDDVLTLSEITEQLFSGKEDRLSDNLIRYIDEIISSQGKETWKENVKALGLKRSGRYGARTIVSYQKVMENTYHLKTLEYELFKKKIEELASIFS